MKFPITVVLENIRSALNVGAIFRTCDAAGVEKLYLTGITPYPPHNRIPKTALGAVEHVTWEYEANTISVIKKLKEDGSKIICVETGKDSVNFWKADLNDKITLVFGNEVSGVSEEVLDMADQKISIPMHGFKESLNVATSFGIAVYEVVRQHRE